jgi:nitrate/nitrite transport system permease protein
MTTKILDPKRSFSIAWLDNLQKAVQGENFLKKTAGVSKNLFLPLFAIIIFLGAWGTAAKNIETSLGLLPGPSQVWGQTVSLWEEHKAERQKEIAFMERQEKRNAKKLAANPDAEVKIRPYTGKPTFIDQIFTSLMTVGVGFLVASVIAIPIGIMTGMSASLYRSLNPIATGDDGGQCSLCE